MENLTDKAVNQPYVANFLRFNRLWKSSFTLRSGKAGESGWASGSRSLCVLRNDVAKPERT